MRIYSVAEPARPNVHITLRDPEHARLYCEEHPGFAILPPRREWTVKGCGLTEQRLSTDDITSAGVLDTVLESNLPRLIQRSNLCGLSGFTLKSLHVKRDGNTAVISIEAWPFSSAKIDFDADTDFTDTALRKGVLYVSGVESDDLPMNEYSAEIARHPLKVMRERAGLSQSQLAEISGVNLRMIQYYEQGVKDINSAKAQTVIKLAKALNCALDDLLSDE